MEYWTVHIAELIAIFSAISLVYKIKHQNPVASTSDPRPATILSDSTSALRAIRNPGTKPGQRIIYAILQSTEELKTQGTSLRLQWIPGHCDNPGNDAADRLAKEAVGPKGTHPFCRPVSREKRLIRDQILKQWEQEWKTSEKGRHLHRIDPLPSVRTRRISSVDNGKYDVWTQVQDDRIEAPIIPDCSPKATFICFRLMIMEGDPKYYWPLLQPCLTTFGVNFIQPPDGWPRR